MASSTIKNTAIHQKIISISGIAVTAKGDQWYYAAPYNITDQLPSGARIIAVNRGRNWDEDCIIDGVTINNRSSIQISSPRSQTISSGREVAVIYTID